jgi:hypothetical protein
MVMSERPEIFQHGEKQENNPFDVEYGSCPLLLDQTYAKNTYLEMKNYIRLLQSLPNPSTEYMQTFTFPDEPKLVSLAPGGMQKIMHKQLEHHGFDFTRFPLKLQKWDVETERWCLLTIDCHLMAASFLVSLNKKLTGQFRDNEHTRQVLNFKTVKMYQDSLLETFNDDALLPDCIHVTAVLTEQTTVDTHLRLTITDEVDFPKLKFTTPAVMATASPDFECCICFGKIDTLLNGNEKILRTGCGTEQGHCFHKKCIDTWFDTGKSSCPICRTIIKHSIQ